MSATVPVSVAFAAGALAALNPCSFPLLPAWFSFYVGADERQLPSASSRAGQGLIAGGTVTVGVLGSFAAAGIPISYGVRRVADALPWIGVAVGVMLTLVGLAALAGKAIPAPVAARFVASRKRGLRAMLLFGLAYGLASLGCTFPVFLALLGVSLSVGGTADMLVVFAAYGAGIAVILVSIALCAALVREGLARRLRRLAPAINRFAGVLLIATGVYLAYYWLRIRFGDTATLSSDPLVGPVSRLAGRFDALARGHGGTVAAVGAAVLLIAALLALRRGASRAVRQ